MSSYNSKPYIVYEASPSSRSSSSSQYYSSGSSTYSNSSSYYQPATMSSSKTSSTRFSSSSSSSHLVRDPNGTRASPHGYYASDTVNSAGTHVTTHNYDRYHYDPAEPRASDARPKDYNRKSSSRR